MGHLLDIIIEVLSYFLSWRAWLCLVLGVIMAYLLSGSGVVFMAGAVLGLSVGCFWEARVG
jgi:uncharacterized membrane protein (DUF441 family)